MVSELSKCQEMLADAMKELSDRKSVDHELLRKINEQRQRIATLEAEAVQRSADMRMLLTNLGAAKIQYRLEQACWLLEEAALALDNLGACRDEDCSDCKRVLVSIRNFLQPNK